MKIKCEYCNNYLEATEEKCPSCGAPNEHLQRKAQETPSTIEELKTWYQEHNLPKEEITRFFLGKDIKEARAFGIYYDAQKGNYIVYKNKSDGVRSIRYEGKDEAYAVNELYMKLKEEILHQKENNLNHSYSRGNYQNTYQTSASNWMKTTIKMIALSFSISVLIPIVIILFISFNYVSSGYYEYNNTTYYLYGLCHRTSKEECEWYKYDEENDRWQQETEITNTLIAKAKKTEWNSTKEDGTRKKEYYEEEWYKELHPPTPTKGYYNYNGNTYYYYDNAWYLYNYGSWSRTSDPTGDLRTNPSTYYDYSSTTNDTYDFTSSSYYHPYSSSSSYDSGSSYSSSDSSWDSGSSWSSSDSWDSGSTDWDSDW